MHNLTEYKKAKIIEPELQEILKIMNLSIKALSFYTKYTKVNESLSCLLTNKRFLELHLKRVHDIIENKGKVDEIK